MKYKSIINSDIFMSFENQRGATLMNHASNSVNIEDCISVMSMLCPEIEIVEDYVFIAELYNGNIEGLKSEYKNEPDKIEKFVNTWSLGDFFIAAHTSSIENEDIILEFGNALVYFWKSRFSHLFPERKIVVEIVENFMGESGYAITVYQPKYAIDVR